MIRHATPPPAPPGFDIRTWLVGCALANPSLVTSTDPVVARSQAMTYADEVIRGMASQNASPTNVEAPSPSQLADMDRRQAEKNARKSTQLGRVTAREIKHPAKTTIADVGDVAEAPGRYSFALPRGSEVPNVR